MTKAERIAAIVAMVFGFYLGVAFAQRQPPL
jgi:hypothetical protein